MEEKKEPLGRRVSRPMYVTDTHALVYYADNKPKRLGKSALRIFRKAEENKTMVYIPTVVLWEIAQRVGDGALTLTTTFEQWCNGLLTAGGFSVAPLEWRDVDEARRLPFKDPFDCLIAGTALHLGMPLITKDAEISDSALIETIW